MDNSNSQRKVLISAAAGIGLENMDIMFLSFSMASIIATFGISGTQAGWIGTITNFGMLLGGIVFGLLADKIGRVKVFFLHCHYFFSRISSHVFRFKYLSCLPV
jgi:MFS family permease